ncbi:MAG: tRNA (adenosine(37)-N6)-dimethylallyltransferase MiaA [Paracoccaceae bacterium]
MQGEMPEIDPNLPVLIAGSTASGKSALALEIARDQGGVVVNADALQVWSCWRLLSARPSVEEESQAPHLLYGHKAPGQDYSVGHWLREVEPILAAHRAGGPRPIIVGGTGLYFAALTEGLAEIPATPPEIRAEADARVARDGHAALLAELDAATAARVDPLNPVRVQRAWEVQRATGRGLAEWQDDTPAPLLPLAACTPLVLAAERDWLADRIDRRFEAMIDARCDRRGARGAAVLGSARVWAKAHGAPELVAFLQGKLPLEAAIVRAQAITRQYAKRQRTWSRSRMRLWHKIACPGLEPGGFSLRS